MDGNKDSMMLTKLAAYWTCDEDEEGGVAYYFAPVQRAAPPYRKQVRVEAIIDIAEDGTLAGVEIIDDRAPPPPSR